MLFGVLASLSDVVRLGEWVVSPRDAAFRGAPGQLVSGAEVGRDRTWLLAQITSGFQHRYSRAP